MKLNNLLLQAVILCRCLPVLHGREQVQSIQVDVDGSLQDTTRTISSSGCLATLQELSRSNDGVIVDDIFFKIHRNGDPEPCGGVTSVTNKAMEQIFQALDLCEKSSLSKYEIEAFLTTLFHQELPEAACGSADDSTATPGLIGHCDMGPERTTIQPDHDRLVSTSSGSLPCRFYTREGERISSLDYLLQLVEEAKANAQRCVKNDGNVEDICDTSATVHLYAVPAGRMFMLAPSYIGETFRLGHVTDLDEDGKAIVIETISVYPRVFEIHDFFSPTEADALIGKAENEQSATHKLHRSTTGATQGQVFSKRTSENAWDTHGKLALKIKRRCLSMLGMDEYWESHTDGLQILRYQSQHLAAYTTHPDYLDIDTEENYNYNSSNIGGNRFATVLLYMSDLEVNAGGETVFEHGWPVGLPDDQRISKLEAVRQLRASPEGTLLTKGSWQEEMTALCQSRLAVRPSRGRAVLFYSQLPNGTGQCGSGICLH
ncbi:hypothetical protein MPSEU_000487500 [Mayamaea pseudoterrestris]|nr:hypothetical protein MPSEU_000487500 [Mayamaea pseudoterrestris]